MKYFFLLIFFQIIGVQLLAQSPLELDQIYEIDYLQSQFNKATAQKDSLLLGRAAYLLNTHLEYMNGTSPKTIELAALSVKCFAAVGDSLNYFNVRNRLAEYYTESEMYEEVEKMYLESKDFYHRKKDLRMEMHAIARLSDIYKRVGSIPKYQEYYAAAQKLNETVRDTVLAITFLINRFHYFQEIKQPDSSIFAAKEALVLAKSIDHPTFISLSQFQIGIMEQEKKNFDKAIFYLKKAEKNDRPIAYSGLRKVSLMHLSQCYESKNDLSNALYFSKRYVALLDSILNKDRKEALDKMAISYETKEKEAAINLLEKENALAESQNYQQTLLLWAFGIILLISLIALGFIIRFYREKSKKDEIILGQNKVLQEQKIQRLEDAVQLTSIKSMLEGQENERARIASDLHDSLGGLLSTIKLQLANLDTPQKINQLLDKATSEVRDISQNLQPSSLEQFGLLTALQDLISMYSSNGKVPKFDLQYYNLPQNLDKAAELQLYRIIQEAVHNSLKHADAQEIIIQLSGAENGLSIIIEDDGKGFDTKENSTGNGLNNMQKRAQFLKADLNVESGEQGTTVFLFLGI